MTFLTKKELKMNGKDLEEESSKSNTITERSQSQTTYGIEVQYLLTSNQDYQTMQNG